MPTSTEVKVRTLKGYRTKDLEDDQPGCFAFCRKLKFWRRRTRSAVSELDDDQLVIGAAADEGVCQADHASQLMPVTAGANEELLVSDLLPAAVTVEDQALPLTKPRLLGIWKG